MLHGIMKAQGEKERYARAYKRMDTVFGYVQNALIISNKHMQRWRWSMSDLIDRQAAIDALDRFSLGETDAVKLAFRMGDYLKRLPSAQLEPIKINIDHELAKDEYEKLRKDLADAPIVLLPERKTGRWIEMGRNKDGTHNLCCGACGKFKFKSKGHANSQYTKERYKFCGGCGAKMEVEHE